MEDVKICLQRRTLTVKIDGKVTNEISLSDGKFNIFYPDGAKHCLRVGREAVMGEDNGILGADISYFDEEISLFFANGEGLIFPLVWDKSVFEPTKFVKPTQEFTHYWTMD